METSLKDEMVCLGAQLFVDDDLAEAGARPLQPGDQVTHLQADRVTVL